MGMNDPIAKQNPQFLLNVMHWLSGLLQKWMFGTVKPFASFSLFLLPLSAELNYSSPSAGSSQQPR